VLRILTAEQARCLTSLATLSNLAYRHEQEANSAGAIDGWVTIFGDEFKRALDG
jgi:hypothetical protein